MSDQQSSSTPAPRRRVALYAAAVTFTVVLASGATILGTQLFAAEPAVPASTLDAAAPPAATPSATTAPAPRIDSTRLVIQGPRRLLDPQAGGTLGAGGEARVPLPTLPKGTTAVLLQLSMRAAKGPGVVILRSSTEQTPVLRLAAPGAQTSATVVAGIGADGDLRVRTEGGGQLLVDLVGAFEPAQTATAGRLVPTPATRLLQLTPRTDGNDADIDLGKLPAPRTAGAVSAVLVQVSGDVGKNGGYVALGPSAGKLDQAVYWSATSGSDRIRPGFVVVPVRSGRIHLEYHAGTQLRVDLVGYVTGPAAPNATAGLVLPVPATAATPAKVTADGRVDVTVVPAGGTAGLTPERVSAALMTVNATGDVPGGVSVDAPGGERAGTPDVSAGKTGRSALALTRVVDGAVNVASDARAVVVLTPRLLVMRD